METCDQSITFEQPLESGKFDLLWQKAKCALSGLFRRKIASTAIESDSQRADISAMDSGEALEPIVKEELLTLEITDEKIHEFEGVIHGILSENFSLQTDDLSDGFIRSVIVEAGGNPLLFNRILFEKIQRNTALLNQTTSRAIDKLKIRVMVEENLSEFIEDIRSEIKNCILGNNYNIDVPAVIQDNPLFDKLTKIDMILFYSHSKRSRKEAIEGIEKIGFCNKLIKKWEENPHYFSDKQMSKLFENHQHEDRLLSTFCGSAFLGIINKTVRDHILRYEKSRYNYDDVNRQCKQSVVSNIDPSRFAVENSIFTRNGSDAFKAFYHNYLKDGDSILLTSEEYYEIENVLCDKGREDKEKKRINVHKLPQYGETEDYLESLKNILKNTDVNYMLISSISRRGSVFPLKKINEVKREIEKNNPGRKIRLIVDGCQSLGRWDMSDISRECEPDVFFASCQKGTDLGGPIGFLGLSTDFVSDEGNKILHEEIGTLRKSDMERFRYGLNPKFAKRAKPDDNIKKAELMASLLTPKERQEAIHGLAVKFAKLLRAVSIKNDERLQILFPTAVFVEKKSTDQTIPLRDRKNIRQERLSGIFELKVEGIDRESVQEIVERYGFSVDLHNDESEKGVSFRIALHPFMGNNSLKILGYALHECCVVAQKEEQMAKKDAKAA